jgi:hypothetical protein
VTQIHKLRAFEEKGHGIYSGTWVSVPIPVAEQSWAYVCGRSLVGIAGSNPVRVMDVCRECCVLSGRGHCVGLIASTEEFYRV